MSHDHIMFVRFLAVVFLSLDVLVAVVTGRKTTPESNGRCMPAEPEPSWNFSGCFPLVNFTEPHWCELHGIRLPTYVYQTPASQPYRNEQIRLYQPTLNVVFKMYADKVPRHNNITILLNAVYLLYCRAFFPPCDDTGNILKERKVCRQTAVNFVEDVVGWDLFRVVANISLADKPYYKKIWSFETFPERNAGDSPECWYHDFKGNFSQKFEPNEDCLYSSGVHYRGNISVTTSGIPCQSWSSQCPHRHTFNTMYPELNGAQNFCRNPQNYGKRPWCFTTDRKKRWEYCDVPACSPVDGGYSNWSLAELCSVSCGDGVEIWYRNCTHPSPRYGGKNCSQLGNSTDYRKCERKPCPVDGGFGNWRLDITCNVSCGNGYETWRRFCNNPAPMNGGNPCDASDNWTELRKCLREPCPVDGNYSNWTRWQPCSVSCGKGVEVWLRTCDNPPPRYGGNCTKHGSGYEVRDCHITECAVKWTSRKIAIATGSAAGAIAVIILIFIGIRYKIRRNRDFQPYAYLRFSEST